MMSASSQLYNQSLVSISRVPLPSQMIEGARLENGFWGGRHGCAFFDVRIFSTLSPLQSPAHFHLL